MILLKVSHLAKALRMSRNQINYVLQREKIKPVEYRNTHTGLTGFYDLDQVASAIKP